MSFQPITSITVQIADHLASEIIKGVLPAGVRIQEVKLARQLDVSRGSVREALLILQRRHLIDLVPRKGAVVSAMSCSEVLEMLGLLKVMEETWLGKLCADESAGGLLKHAEKSLADMENAARESDLAGLLAARTLFYEALLGRAGPHARAVFDALLPASQRLLYKLTSDAKVDLHDFPRFYRALHESISQHDSVRLTELLAALHRRLEGLGAKTSLGTSQAA